LEIVRIYFATDLNTTLNEIIILYSDVLCELYYIQINVQLGSTERANKNIRAYLRLLNNEAFLRENGVLVYEVIELYDQVQHDDGEISAWKVNTLFNYKRSELNT
jgi:hypothetical protein